MKFLEFYYSYGWLVTVALGLITIASTKRIAPLFGMLQLLSFALMFYSFYAVLDERYKAHYKVGNCYVRGPVSKYDRPSLSMVVDKDDKEYVFAYYLEDRNEFVITDGYPEHMPFHSFEIEYSKDTDCPNAQTYVIRRH